MVPPACWRVLFGDLDGSNLETDKTLKTKEGQQDQIPVVRLQNWSQTLLMSNLGC